MNEFKQDGYIFGRNESKPFMKWTPRLPIEMKHYQMMQIPHFKQQNNPMYKTVNKIRLSNTFFNGSLLQTKSATRPEEETTLRSMSSASKIYDLKSSYRKAVTEESTQEGLMSLTSGRQLLDSRRSLLSSRQQASDKKQERPSKDKKKKKKMKFDSEYRPAILTTTECRFL